MKPCRAKDPLFCPGCGNHLDACCCGQGQNPFDDEPIDPDPHKTDLEMAFGIMNTIGMAAMFWAVILTVVGGLYR